jgi:hypothetical protein
VCPSIGNESEASDRHAVVAWIEADVLSWLAVDLFEEEFQHCFIAAVGKILCFEDKRLHFFVGDVGR